MTQTYPRHEPVMLAEVMRVLSLKPGDTVVDGTLGLAGHFLEMLKAVSPGGTAIGFDWDAEMMDHAKRIIGEPPNANVQLHNRDFRDIPDLVESADGVLLDLGLNSAQVDDPSRGISFQADGPLDMRMDRSRGEPASALLNRMTSLQIERMLKQYGDERWAKAIARTIVDRRKDAPLKTTEDLKQCVLAAIPPGARDKRIHPATRAFQACRIYVNRELEGLDEAVGRIARCLKPGGRLAVLSYHSGEDRIIKQTFRELAQQGFEELFKKPLTPTAEEVARNPRSRSAKLRAIQRSCLEQESSQP